MDDKREQQGIVLTEAQKRSRRHRSIAIALALGVLVVLFATLLVEVVVRAAAPLIGSWFA